jgi:hypothetical protein
MYHVTKFANLITADNPANDPRPGYLQEIAALHGATITLAEDSDGLGNTFTVAFPLPEHAAVSAA